MFEPCPAGVGKLNQKCQIFPVEYKCFTLNMKVSIGKELIFVREWLKSKGLQGLVIKGWSICRKSQLLILPFIKKIDH